MEKGCVSYPSASYSTPALASISAGEQSQIPLSRFHLVHLCFIHSFQIFYPVVKDISVGICKADGSAWADLLDAFEMGLIVVAGYNQIILVGRAFVAAGRYL